MPKGAQDSKTQDSKTAGTEHGFGVYLRTLREIEQAERHPIDAASFCATLAANTDNDRLSDQEFRDFVRRTLPSVNFPRGRGAGV